MKFVHIFENMIIDARHFVSALLMLLFITGLVHDVVIDLFPNQAYADDMDDSAGNTDGTESEMDQDPDDSMTMEQQIVPENCPLFKTMFAAHHYLDDGPAPIGVSQTDPPPKSTC